jgi:hypothetical protein
MESEQPASRHRFLRTTMDIVLFLWAFCIFAGWAVGSVKEDPVAGLFLGFFLGPVGVIAIAVSAGGGVRCRHCRERVKAGASVCKHCHSELNN